MTKSLIPKAVIGLGAVMAIYLNVVTPIGLERLPQAVAPVPASIAIAEPGK